MNELDRFKETYLYPALYERIPTIFDWLKWDSVPKQTNSPVRWVSRQHLDGTPDSAGANTTNITRTHWYCVYDYNGTPRGLINWYMERKNLDFWTALNELADLCGVKSFVPHGDGERWKKREELNDNREKAYNILYEALYSNTAEAREALNYLRQRKWTDEEIKKARLGLVTKDIIASLPTDVREEFTLTVEDEKNTDTKITIGETHTLVIALHNRSLNYGFKVRTIHDDKYKTRYLNTKGTPKTKYFYGLTHTDKVIIVEGELDALHAKVRGAVNVVATSGGAASVDQLKDAIEKGVRKFCLLFDNDKGGRKFIDDTLENILLASDGAGNIDTYITSLPEEKKDDGKPVKDVDDYLGLHTIEEFNRVVIENNNPACEYLLGKVYEKWDKKKRINNEERNDFFDDVIGVVNSPHTRPSNRETLFTLFIAPLQKQLQFNVDDLRKEADKAQSYDREKKLTTSIQNAQKLIEKALREKDLTEAIRLLRETSKSVSASYKASTFARVFAHETAKEVSTYLGSYTAGIPTEFVFKNKDQFEPLTFNVGLSFVCGSRGHGKTSFLNNLVLQNARRNLHLNNGKSVLYFSYEVQKRRILADLINTYINDKNISRNPTETILSYFAGHGDKYFFQKEEADKKKQKYDRFIAKKDEFLTDYIESEAIKVIEENYKVGELLDAIDYYIHTAKREISIVFIDYAQLIFSEDYSRARTEEIKRIVNDIKDYANHNSLPFVMACQFNREVVSPVSVDTKNIGEGGDYERIADTCIGLFNLEKLGKLTGTNAQSETEEAIKLLRKLGVYDKGVSELSPSPNKMFVRLLKRRNGVYPLDTIVEWEGRTKFVKGNNPDPDALYKEALDLYDVADDEEEEPSGF